MNELGDAGKRLLVIYSNEMLTSFQLSSFKESYTSQATSTVFVNHKLSELMLPEIEAFTN